MCACGATPFTRGGGWARIRILCAEMLARLVFRARWLAFAKSWSEAYNQLGRIRRIFNFTMATVPFSLIFVGQNDRIVELDAL